MAREDPQMKLRLPEGMRDRIAEEAKRNNRSMNAEIVARLEKTFDPEVLLIRTLDDVPELAAAQQRWDHAAAELEKVTQEARENAKRYIEESRAKAAHLRTGPLTVDEIVRELGDIVIRAKGLLADKPPGG